MSCTDAKIDLLWLRLVLVGNLVLRSLIIDDRTFGEAQLQLPISWVGHALNLLSVVIVLLILSFLLLLDMIPLGKILNLILFKLCGLAIRDAIALVLLLNLSLGVQLVQLLLVLFEVLLMLQILLLALHLSY